MPSKLARITAGLPLLIAASFISLPASAIPVTGVTVKEGTSTDVIGSLDGNGKTEYFIPLSSNHTGTYGVGNVPCGDKTGLCSDGGTGQGYATADALEMNIYFNLGGAPQSVAASLNFHFDDLDLEPTNDPKGFRESVLLSYWDVGNNKYQQVGSVIDHTSELTSGAFSGGAATTTPGTLDDPSDDPFSWHLDLVALGLLSDLNASVASLGGFWVQLGFGSEYVDRNGHPKHGHNTVELLSADLHVSPVPVPSAVWLFGSALIGFIGLSRRTRV